MQHTYSWYHMLQRGRIFWGAQECRQILLKGWLKRSWGHTEKNVATFVLNHSHRRWPLEVWVLPQLFESSAWRNLMQLSTNLNHVETRRTLKTSQRATVNMDGESLSSSRPLHAGHWARQRHWVGWKESLPAASWSRAPFPNCLRSHSTEWSPHKWQWEFCAFYLLIKIVVKYMSLGTSKNKTI